MSNYTDYKSEYRFQLEMASEEHQLLIRRNRLEELRSSERLRVLAQACDDMDANPQPAPVGLGDHLADIGRVVEESEMSQVASVLRLAVQKFARAVLGDLANMGQAHPPRCDDPVDPTPPPNDSFGQEYPPRCDDPVDPTPPPNDSFGQAHPPRCDDPVDPTPPPDDSFARAKRVRLDTPAIRAAIADLRGSAVDLRGSAVDLGGDDDLDGDAKVERVGVLSS